MQVALTRNEMRPTPSCAANEDEEWVTCNLPGGSLPPDHSGDANLIAGGVPNAFQRGKSVELGKPAAQRAKGW